MKKSLAILAAVGVASAASAQSWQFEFDQSELSPAQPSTLVTASIDPGPADYAVAGANFNVHASAGEWSNPATLLTHPGQEPGTPSGSSVLGASIGQLALFGFVPAPGRINVWTGNLEVSDFTIGSVDVSTETTRFEVYPIEPASTVPPSTGTEARVATEGRASIRVIPAPASLALLGLGGLAAARRRR